jgi:hypothetical protein
MVIGSINAFIISKLKYMKRAVSKAAKGFLEAQNPKPK